MSKNKYNQEVKSDIEVLIQAETIFDIEKLEEIYHDDLKIIMIDENGETMLENKNMFKTFFK